MAKKVFNSRTKDSKDNWETPQYFFDLLNIEFNFTLDPCASHKNHKCDNYYTIEDNGLTQDWGGERVFCNPPYAKKDKWIEKGFKEAQKLSTIVVMLIPTYSDTRIWHKFVMKAYELRLVKGRISFLLNGKKQASPNFPSSVVVFTCAGKDIPLVTSSFYHKPIDIFKFADIGGF